MYWYCSGSASHLVLATQCQNLREAYVEEQPGPSGQAKTINDFNSV